MPRRFSKEFKLQAVERAVEEERPLTEVARTRHSSLGHVSPVEFERRLLSCVHEVGQDQSKNPLLNTESVSVLSVLCGLLLLPFLGALGG